MGIFKTIGDMLKGGEETNMVCCGKLHYNDDPACAARYAKSQGATIKITGTNDDAVQLYNNVVEARKLAGKEHVDMEWIKDKDRIIAMSLEPALPNLIICGKMAAYAQLLPVDQLTEMVQRLLPDKEDADEEVVQLNADECECDGKDKK
jgi:hypothetical protein